ncbi:putative developmentally regulated phosphoprotein [Trypanosoma vivax]|nr:putative developmentally regulated phosphoprotein [Trypanosoma vivax]
MLKRILILRNSFNLSCGKVHDTTALLDQLTILGKRVEEIEQRQALQSILDFYSSRPLSSTSKPEDFIAFCAKSERNAKIFCHVELPILLARLIAIADSFPCGLGSMCSTLLVRNIYLESFKRLINCEFPESSEKEQQFVKVVKENEKAHMKRDILRTMGTGVMELKGILSSHERFLMDAQEMNSFKEVESPSQEWLMKLTPSLDEFCFCMVNYNFLSRTLLNVEVLKKEKLDVLELQIDLEKTVRNAVDDAKNICIQTYGDCPDVKFIFLSDGKPMKYAYLTSTISYIVIELMKNAFRATIESHMEDKSSPIVNWENISAVEVLVSAKETAKHACIRISDEGRGMTETQRKMALSYAYTSMKKSRLNTCMGDEDNEGASPIAGYGFGLPMSRVYARYFGGDVVLSTMEGYGTCVYYFIQI